MARRPNPFDTLSDDERHKVMRDSVIGMLGPQVGGAFWARMEPVLVDRRRMPGDAPMPEDNFWKGRWRVYEAH